MFSFFPAKKTPTSQNSMRLSVQSILSHPVNLYSLFIYLEIFRKICRYVILMYKLKNMRLMDQSAAKFETWPSVKADINCQLMQIGVKWSTIDQQIEIFPKAAFLN